jgi:hypothetical protein
MLLRIDIQVFRIPVLRIIPNNERIGFRISNNAEQRINGYIVWILYDTVIGKSYDLGDGIGPHGDTHDFAAVQTETGAALLDCIVMKMMRKPLLIRCLLRRLGRLFVLADDAASCEYEYHTYILHEESVLFFPCVHNISIGLFNE